MASSSGSLLFACVDGYLSCAKTLKNGSRAGIYDACAGAAKFVATPAPLAERPKPVCI